MALNGFGEIDGCALKANPAVASDLSDPVVAFVIRGFGFSIRRFCAEFVNVVRSFHVQSLVRALCIVFSSKPVEAFLLLQKVTTGGPSGLFFEGEMQSFESSVLLWMARFKFLVSYTERSPPRGKRGESQKSAAGKWKNHCTWRRWITKRARWTLSGQTARRHSGIIRRQRRAVTRCSSELSNGPISNHITVLGN